MAVNKLSVFLTFLFLISLSSAADYEVVSTVVESTTLQIVVATTFGWLFGHLLDAYFDNPIGIFLKWAIYASVAIGLYLYLFTDFFAEHRIEKENGGSYMHWSIRWYTSLPWNILSRIYGYYSKVKIPKFMRRFLYGNYAKRYNCNMEEAEKTYEDYPTFAEFFNRKLKPGIRPISHAPVVSPADGIIVHYGEVKEGDKIVYVKGQDFDLNEFLGPVKVYRQPGMKLYQVCIYLTPGSYHSFHSQAKWTMKEIFHHPGDLFKVRPGFINFIPRIFCVNERVSLCGEWEHGFMSMTAVAATYVGDIVIDVEDPTHPILSHGENTTPYSHHKVDHSLKPGEKLGQFRNGSVNVLVFEGPPDLKFCIKPGQSINYGMPLVN